MDWGAQVSLLLLLLIVSSQFDNDDIEELELDWEAKESHTNKGTMTSETSDADTELSELLLERKDPVL